MAYCNHSPWWSPDQHSRIMGMEWRISALVTMKFTEYHSWTLQAHALYPSSKQWEGDTFTRNRSDITGTRTTLWDKDFLVPCRLSMEAIGPSMHPNDTYPCFKLNHEPSQLPGGSTHLHGVGKPYQTPPCLRIFAVNCCVVDTIISTFVWQFLLCNVTLFDANAHMINSTQPCWCVVD